MSKPVANFTNSITTLSEENASVLIEIILDPSTPDHIRIKALNALTEASDTNSFFDLLLENGMDYAACPECGHENHWLIPEVELNQRNIFTFERDNRVKKNTTEQDCVKYQQACGKLKITY